MGSKATGAWCQLPHPCHCYQTNQKAPRCPQRGRQWGEARAHMKINLPIFKDEDAKDAVTYQVGGGTLMVYHHAGC